ncbi:Signal recognition particle subunit SRP72 [Escovopsis weberi]|uniref:Signal recognition particle subunit SRP72 n=1 Tax=Escovopsis weberi TaxID=150374 RepID=A0A0M8MUZ3_ESCWE|nr:Signal recognition particle subunit SRP72 [Escovopsis weberi]
MPSDPRAALSSLLRAADIEDHEEIIKAANVAIKADPADDAAKHTKVVALLKLDRFDDALRLIDGHGTQLQGLCALEKAYALYKVGKLAEADALIKATGLEKRSMRHIAAQVAYRAERFQEARNIYSQMLDSDPAIEASDLKINAIAAAAQADWHRSSADSSLVPAQETAETFEACYNLASGEIARGNLGHAANLLHRAAILCDNSDELSDEEKQSELRPIRAQQAFILAKQGKFEEALGVYQSLGPVTENDGKDFEIIARSNLLVLESAGGNPYLRQRKNEALAPLLPAGKLFTNQKETLQKNKLVIDLEAKKVNGVRNRTGLILGETQDPTLGAFHNSISALHAAAEIDGLSDREALRKLQLLATKRPKDVGLVLTIIQIQVQQQQLGSALSVLEAFLARLESSPDAADQDARFGPGIVALAVSLYRAQQRAAAAKSELIKAARHWQTRPAASVSTLLLGAGVELMRSSNAEDLALAGSSFEKLFAEKRGSGIASAGLVASLAAASGASSASSSELAQHSAQLPPVEDLVAGIDVDQLLAAGVASGSSAQVSRKRAAAEAAAAADEPSERPAQKRRKRKLPKGYVEGKTPDPERWLPLRDRSSYRPKGRKGKKKAAESTQGGFVKEEETLELVGGGGVKVEKSSGGSAASKKKKKGKK